MSVCVCVIDTKKRKEFPDAPLGGLSIKFGASTRGLEI